MRCSRKTSSSCLLILIFAIATAVRAGDKPVSGPVAIGDLRVEDLGGQPHWLLGSADTKVVALVFLSTECPISNQSIPELNRIAAAHESPAVRFFGVLSDRNVTRAQAAVLIVRTLPAVP